jgi:hypothetical protein
MQSLNRAQRVVIVVGLAFALYVSGQWLTSLGTTVNYGWVAYAPLSKQLAPGGIRPWVQFLIWLVLIGVWAVVSLTLLRSNQRQDN